MATPRTGNHIRAAISTQNLRLFLGFAAVGFANVLLPSIIFSAGYLIVPYPRAVVLLIELLPALVVKLAFPYLLGHIPPWTRPIGFAACWALATLVTIVTPPNVPPLSRVLITVLASATAAATDVSLLSHLRHCGMPALVGWGLGAGTGTVVSSVMPFVVTMRWNKLLRSLTEYAFYLILTIFIAYFVILSDAGMLGKSDQRSAANNTGSTNENEDSYPLFQPSSKVSSVLKKHSPRRLVVFSLMRPYIASLFVLFAAQAALYPGISRAMPSSISFETYSHFYATYGFALAAGGLVSRVSILVWRTHNVKPLLAATVFIACVVMSNFIFLVTASTDITTVMILAAGSIGGVAYMNTLTSATEALAREYGPDGDSFLGLLGSGESAGALVGALLGATWEYLLCSARNSNGRWCSA